MEEEVWKVLTKEEEEVEDGGERKLLELEILKVEPEQSIIIIEIKLIAR